MRNNFVAKHGLRINTHKIHQDHHQKAVDKIAKDELKEEAYTHMKCDHGVAYNLPCALCEMETEEEELAHKASRPHPGNPNF